MAAYVDYAFYSSKESYAGSTIPEDAFDYWAIQASGRIDEVTFDRSTSAEGEDLKKIKMATCAVADVLYKLDKDGGILASERSSEYSRTMKIQENDSEDKRVRAAATLYLGRTGLMYRGLDDVL